MNKYLKIFFSLFISLTVIGCDTDDDSLGVDLEGLSSPTNLGATFQITQDNTGLVTIIPTGEGATLYSVDFGDGSPASDELRPGETVTHVYAEGNYEVVITGTNLAGESAEGVQPLTVSFRQPENLEFTVTRDPADNYTVSVSATADFAAMFNVYFGDVEDEEPTPLMLGESVSHTYETTGTYDVRVVALSGGEATLEATQEVVISDPLFLPIDFESEKLNYTFINFGPDVVDGVPIVDNPDPNDVNSSSKVAKYTKPAGSEPWAGTTIALDEPIDFASKKYISVDVWSPTAGTPVTFKVENLGNADINAEVSVNTTVSEEWETLIFDFSSIDVAQEFGRIVLFFNLGTPGTGQTYYFDNIATTTLEPLKLPITFDSNAVTYNPAVFNGASFEVVANPDLTGANTSASLVGAVTNSGNNWEGLSFNLEEPVDFSGDDKTITMKFWSDVALPVLLKFEGGVNGERQNEVVATHTGSGWEELSFNFSTNATKSYIDGSQGVGEPFVPTGQYATMTIFVDGPGNSAGTFYLDDIRLGGTSYISLFSEVAEDVTVDTWRTSWSNAAYEEVNFEGRLTKHYNNLDFVGIETVSEQLDITDMTHLHLEIYTTNATTFRVKLVDFGPDGGFNGGDDTEHEVVIENPALNQWVTLDIPLSQFENLTTREHISQIIFSALPAGTANVYVSNIYFHN